ncbi:MAG: hypothetical protein WBO29_15845 [Albidovulum sp.]
MMRFAWPAFAVALLLAACGPMTVERAERECFSRAYHAASPRGKVKVGAGNGGARAVLDLTITSDFIQGRDPSAVYDACVYQKSGQPPRQPLYTLPDWKG